jgi:hypothetical protein
MLRRRGRSSVRVIGWGAKAVVRTTREDTAMIVVRTVFRAHFGQAGALAAAMVEGNQQFAQATGRQERWRVLTDRSGPFDTVVFEVEVESMAEWERTRDEVFSNPEFQSLMARTQGMVAEGSAEFYYIEGQG